MIDAPSDVAALLASRPRVAFIANLFTFTLASGPVYRFTDWRRPLTAGGHVFLAGPPRLQRGTLRVERGVAVSTMQLTLQEANDEFIALLARGYFRRAVFKMQRVFAADANLEWTQPITKFFGRVNAVDELSRTAAKMTVKSMLDDLDNDYPREVVTPDCNAVLFDERCGLSAAAYRVTGAAGAGSTKLKLMTGLSNVEDYFTQGVLTFAEGPMSGLSYLVKKYAGGVVVPAYPFLVPPETGTAFMVTPGCEKTLDVCRSKYGYDPTTGAAPYFRGMPFVPDPTVTY